MVATPAAGIVPDGVGPSRPATEEPTSEQMFAMLALLPQKQQEVLLLRVVQGLSADEVAFRLGVKVGAVRVAQQRALNKLRHLVEDHSVRNQQSVDVDSTQIWKDLIKFEAAVGPRAQIITDPAAHRPMPLAQERTEFVIAAVGSAANLAKLLDVSRSQPTRWRKGEEVPSPSVARALLDLDYVMARALMLFPQPVALDWLTSSNSFLNGARPIEVLQIRGSTEVIQALDAVMAGAFS